MSLRVPKEGPLRESINLPLRGEINWGRKFQYHDSSREEIDELCTSLRLKIDSKDDFATSAELILYEQRWNELVEHGMTLMSLLQHDNNFQKSAFINSLIDSRNQEFPGYHDLSYFPCGDKSQPSLRIRKKIGIPLLEDFEVVKGCLTHPNMVKELAFDDFYKQISRPHRNPESGRMECASPPFARINIEYWYHSSIDSKPFLKIKVRQNGNFEEKSSAEAIFQVESISTMNSNQITRQVDALTKGLLDVFSQSAVSLIKYINEFDSEITDPHIKVVPDEAPSFATTQVAR